MADVPTHRGASSRSDGPPEYDWLGSISKYVQATGTHWDDPGMQAETLDYSESEYDHNGNKKPKQKKKKYDDLRHAFKYSRKALKNARDNSLATLENYYQQGQEQLAPWHEYGQQSLEDLGRGTQEYAEMVRDPSKYQQSPGYQWQLEQGLEGLNRGAAMAGKLDSGQNQKDLMAYGQGLALQDYQNSINRYQSLLNVFAQGANLGYGADQTSASMAQQMGANTSNVYQAYGNNAANLYWQMGQARGQQKQAGAAQQGALLNTGLGAVGMGLGAYFGGAPGALLGKQAADTLAPQQQQVPSQASLQLQYGQAQGNNYNQDSSVYR